MEFRDNFGKSKVSKIVASFVTIAVVVLLILAGPAQAFTLSFDSVSNASPKQGEIISFIAKLSIKSNEFMNIGEIELYDDASEETLCTFTADGKNTSACEGITVGNLQNGTSDKGYGYGYGYEYYQDYGYGYGYGHHDGYNGDYKYNVTINTSELSAGTYNLILKTLQAEDYVYYTHTPLTITILNDDEQLANDPVETIQENKTQVVFNQNSSAVREIVINSSIDESKEITLNMSALLSGDTVSVTNAINLTRETSSSEYSAEIPAGTVITGPAGWDGSIVLPTIESNSAVSLSGSDTQVVVKLGGNAELNFSKPVKITLSGMGNKSAAWARGGITHNIPTTCTIDNDPDMLVGGVRECYNNTGSDLVIWTLHFTEFAAYTPKVATTTTTTSQSSYGTPRKMASPTTTPETTAPTTDNTAGTPSTNDQTAGRGFLTGFVVGAGEILKSPISWVVIAAVVIIGGGAIALRFRKTPGKSKKSRSKKSKAKDEDLDADMD